MDGANRRKRCLQSPVMHRRFDDVKCDRITPMTAVPGHRLRRGGDRRRDDELTGADARDKLLGALGFSNIVFFSDLPNKVQSADQDSLRGHVLSNGIDANGRMIGFVYPGEPTQPDGADVFLDVALLDASLNAGLLAAGHAYPAFYATLPAALRTHLAGLSRAAREHQPALELWARSTADPNGAATIADLAALEQLVLWPKLFRRIVPYFAAGFTNFDGFDAWLRAGPVDRDDGVFLLDRLEVGNLHDVITAAGNTIQMTVWPEDLIINPDPVAPTTGPPPPVTPPVPQPSPAAGSAAGSGSVLVIAALPNPVGQDRGNESATLLNTTPAAVPLTGWQLSDAAGASHTLSGSLAAGDTLRVTLTTAVQLGNRGDTIRLTDEHGTVIDEVTYQATDVHNGRTIAFRR